MSIFGSIINLANDVIELPFAVLDGEGVDKVDDIINDLFGND